jgi:PAS domain S-box-containing protein
MPPAAPGGGDLARVIEAGGDAVVVLDGEWRYAYVNGPAEELIGRTAKDLVGRRVMDVFPGIEETAFWRVYQRAVREQALLSVEEFYEPLGRRFCVRAVPHGELLYLLFQDVTERRRAEAELRRELQVRDAITANAADALFLMDAAGRITFLNPAAERTFGWRADEVVGRVLHDVLHHHRPDGTPFPFAECPLGEVMRSGRTLQGHEELFFRKDGSPVPVLCSNAPLRSAEGAITGGVLVVSDISERKAAEEELRRSAEALRLSEERYRALVDASSQIVWTNSPEGRMAGEQSGWAAFTGQGAEEYQGFGWSEAVHPDDRRPTVDEWNRCVRECVPFLWEHRVRRRDGVYRTFSIRGVPVLNGDGTIREWVGIHTDVTEKRADEAALRERSRQLRLLAEASLVINSTASLPEMFQAITDKAREVVGAHQGVVSITREEDWSQAINAVSLSEKYGAWRDCAAAPDGSGIYAVACRENRTVRLTQAELMAHPARRGFGAHAAEHPPMNGWLAVPLVGKGGANLGLIQLSDKYEGEFTADDEAHAGATVAARLGRHREPAPPGGGARPRWTPGGAQPAEHRAPLLAESRRDRAGGGRGSRRGVGGGPLLMVEYRLAEDCSVISCEYRSRPDELPPLTGRYTLSDFDTVMEGLYRSPEAQVVRDVRADAFSSDETAKMEALGMRAFVRVPLYDGGAVAGAVGWRWPACPGRGPRRR